MSQIYGHSTDGPVKLKANPTTGALMVEIANIQEYLDVLANFGIPLIVPSSGSIGNNGALTAIAALPDTYSKCFMYFPADSIEVGIPAGIYYVEMSSTTAGTIYNNEYQGGSPSAPDTPTAFVTTGPGAYTQDIAIDIDLFSLTIEANSLGVNGSLQLTALIQMRSSADDKIEVYTFGGTDFFLPAASTTSTEKARQVEITNVGVANQQVGYALVSDAPVIVTGAVNTAQDQVLKVSVQLEAATDFILLSGVRVLLYRNI